MDPIGAKIPESIPSKQSKEVKTEADAREILIEILNVALGERQDIKLTKRTFDEHKASANAQESHLEEGDIFEIMTNSLTYDLDGNSSKMIANSLRNGVRYYYYLEKNSATQRALIKFLHQLLMNLKEECDELAAKQILNENLYLYWLPEKRYPYSFSLFNRPNASTMDHCTFYFIKTERHKYLYEILIDNDSVDVERLASVFYWFKNNIERLDLSKLIDCR